MPTILADEKCVPVRSDTPAADKSQIEEYFTQIPGWQIVSHHGVERLQRVYRFDNFVQALAFTNQIGEIAEIEDHHPAILIEWGKVTVNWWTHVVKGLHRNDFIMAAKTDRLYPSG